MITVNKLYICDICGGFTVERLWQNGEPTDFIECSNCGHVDNYSNRKEFDGDDLDKDDNELE